MEVTVFQIIAAVTGAALVVSGLALMFLPLALIAAGAGLLAFGLLYDTTKPPTT